MRRRRFLKLSLFSSLALGGAAALGTAGAALFGWTGQGAGRPELSGEVLGRLACLSAGQAEILRAALVRILDGATLTAADPEAARQRHLLFADRYLAGLDGAIQDDFRHLLALLEYYPLGAGHRARFTRLSDAAQDEILAGWSRSRWDLLRQGFQGLKGLACLSFYQDEASFAAIGYTGPLV